jgi:hypothetical protein
MRPLESGPAQWAAARANAPAWFDRAPATPFNERRVEVEGGSIR